MKYKLINSDCIHYLQNYTGEKFDMIFADPPYRLSNGGITCQNGKMVLVDKGDWDISLGLDGNREFDELWIKLCLDNLKDDGTFWISGTYHNIHIIGSIVQGLGCHIINEITWYKPNAAPNISCRAFTASHETLLWIKKTKQSKHKFNYQDMKIINNGKQMRALWEIPTTPKREKKYTNHPTQKPIELLKRCILSSTHHDDLVFDPFAGSATTGVVCIKNERRFIGVEMDKTYYTESKKRLEIENKKATPFIKWAGGKTQLLEHLEENLPDIETVDTYIEPFIGGGAMFLHMHQKYKFENIIINDMNSALINVYKVIRDNVDELMDILDLYTTEYNNLKDDKSKEEYFVCQRKTFNKEERVSVKGAAIFIFLNKSCFNGLYRENSKGEFNVPTGKKKNITLYDKYNLLKISELLNEKNSENKLRVKILCGSYKKISKYISDSTFVYMDPPYRPITKSGFNQYHKSRFGDAEQIELASFCRKLNTSNAKFMLSNSDPQNQIDTNEPFFFDDLYRDFKIIRINARRNINSKSSGRGPITEILVKNY